MDKACVSSTVFSYVRSHFVQVPSSHLPSQMAIQNLGNILSAKWRLSRVCRTHLTNLSQLPPQIRCYHFPPKPVIQANSSPFTKNRKTEPAKLNASNVIPLKTQKVAPISHQKLKFNFKFLNTFITRAIKPPSKKQRVASLVYVTEFLLMGAATSASFHM